MKYTLRPATETDAPFLAELFADVRGPEFRLAGIPAPMVEQLLAMQHRAQSMSYAAQFPEAVDQIIWIGDERAGRSLVDFGADEIRLVDIALLTKHRGLGVGSALLGELCETALASSRSLQLSVRPGNRAARLYERMGFVAVGADEANTHMEWRGKTSPSPTPISPEPVAEPSGDVPQGLTRAYFNTLVGQMIPFYALDLPGRPQGPLELIVDAVLPLPVLAFNNNVEVGDSFIVRLHGPVEPALLPECAELQPVGGERMTIFLTPLGPVGGQMQYEIVFNRSRLI